MQVVCLYSADYQIVKARSLKMMPVDNQRGLHIDGAGFQCIMRCKDVHLQIEAVDFHRGAVFEAKITNELIASQKKEFQFLSSIQRLAHELQSNGALFINDEGVLMAPVKITWKGEEDYFGFELRLSRKELSESQFREYMKQEIDKIRAKSSQREEVMGAKMEEMRAEITVKQTEFSAKEALSLQQIGHLQRRISELSDRSHQLFDFKGIRQHPHARNYRTSSHGSVVKRIQQGLIWHNFPSFHALPETGRHYFKLRVSVTQNKAIFVGVCSQDKKTSGDDELAFSNSVVCLDLRDGSVLATGIKVKPAVRQIAEDDKPWVEVVVDMHWKEISWRHNGKIAHEYKLPPALQEVRLHGYLSMFNSGDEVQFTSE